jgi:DNA sulfur modification protein DndB
MKRRYLPALRGRLGTWAFYSCHMPAPEVVERITFAHDLFKSERLSDFIQRKLQEGRAKDIAAYLLRDDERFFNSLVVGVVGGDPSWHEISEVSGRVDIHLPSSESRSLGYLSFDGTEKMFALDGQHRLFGIAEALKRDRERIEEDTISLIFVAHKDTASGMRRSRHLFATLNKNAKPIGKGERIATDEADVMAIVTRAMIEENIHFRDQEIRFVQTDALPSGDKDHFTTIGNLYDVLTTIFSKIGNRRTTDLMSIRPSDGEIADLKEEASRFFQEARRHFPALDEYFSSNDGPAKIRKYRSAEGGHLLFRPVGLRMLADLVSYFVREEKFSLEQAFKRLSEMPTELGCEPYSGVIWLPAQSRMNPSKRPLARDLVLHVLRAEKTLQNLHERYAKQLGLSLKECQLPRPIL